MGVAPKELKYRLDSPAISSMVGLSSTGENDVSEKTPAQKINNPVPELARIFKISYEDAYVLTVHVPASDETWTTDFVREMLALSKEKAADRDKPMIEVTMSRLPAMTEIIGNIGWFVQGVACSMPKE